MNIWHDMSSDRVKTNDFVAVIEISKGSQKKYELDKETGMIILDRILHTSTHYPANYGFIPKTLSEDHDPLDVLVICSQALEPGTLVRCYPIGILNMIDGGEKDEKIIAIAYKDPVYNSYKDINDLPEHTYKEIAHFFSVYKALENGDIQVGPVSGAKDAEKIIAEAIETYNKTYNK